MKQYALKKTMAVLLLALVVAAFAAFGAAHFFGGGRFLGLSKTISRYQSGSVWFPVIIVFLSVLLLILAVLLPALARKNFSEFLTPGLHHYYDTKKFGAQRIHLRVEKDGSSILMIDAYRVVHLNRTATIMVKYFLDDYPEAEICRRLAATFHIAKTKAGHDYHSMLEKVDLLINRSDICPVTFFDIDKIEAFQTPVSAPYRMDLALTYRCNINCSHCYNQRRKSAELSTDDWKKIIKTLWDNGIPHVDFTGGEPTLRDDLLELIAYAEDLGIITGLLTNGVRLADEKFVARLKEAGLDYVQITIESQLKEVHNRMVASDTFAQTVQGIKNIVSRQIHVITNTTITTANQDKLDGLIPFLKKLGVRSFAVNSIIKAGKSRHQDNGLSEKELLPLIKNLRQQAEQEAMKFTWYTPTQYCRLNPVEFDLGIKQCTAGKYNLAIEPDGTVIPCQSFYRPLGNILNDPFEKIYNHDFLIALRRRDWAMDKCRECEWLPTCGCGCPLQISEDSFCCPDLLSNP